MSTTTKKEELINLWLKVMPNDQRDVLQRYCDHMIKSDDDVITIYEQGKCVAAVGAIFTTFSYNGIEISAAIGGYLCVDTQYQAKGYSLAIAQKFNTYCTELGVDLVIGWEISSKLRYLYETTGNFIFRDYVKQTTVNKTDIPACQMEEYRIETTKTEITKEYNKFVEKRYRNYIIHNQDAFELMGSEGEFFLAYDKTGEIQGIAIRLDCTPDNYIEEIIATNQNVKSSLLNHICAHYKWGQITYSENGMGVEGAQISHGMMRILNAEGMIKHYAALHPQYEDTFTVKDTISTKICKTYKIGQGKCEVVDFDESVKEITIQQLNELLLSEYYLNLCVVC